MNFISIADITWDESIDENLTPNMTVRFALRSGELRYKDGVTQKMIVQEVRSPKPKRQREISTRGIRAAAATPTIGTTAIAGPSSSTSGMQTNLIGHSLLIGMVFWQNELQQNWIFQTKKTLRLCFSWV